MAASRSKAFVAAVLLLYWTLAPGQSAPPSHDLIGMYPAKSLESLRPGDIYTFEGPDKKVYQGVFTQKHAGQGGQPDLYLLDGIVEVPPAPTAETGKANSGTSSSGGGTGGPGGGAGAAAGDGGASSTGAGAAAGAAFTTLAGYIAVPPSLRRELAQRQERFNEAVRAQELQVSLYQSTLSATVAGAKQATEALRAAAANTKFSVPAAPEATATQLPDFSGAPWPLRRSLESSFVSLTGARPPSVAHAQIRAMGLHAVDSAQSQIGSKDLQAAAASAKLAEAAASVLRTTGDLLIGLNPLTAMARDATELITGRDLLSAQPLSTEELWIRAVSLGASMVTAGVGSTIRQTLSRVSPAINSANGVRKLLDYTLDVSQHVRTRWWRVDKTLGTMTTNGTDAEVRDLAFRAITEGHAYYDTLHKNTAFFLKGEKRWLQVIVDFDAQKVVGVTPRGLNYDFAHRIQTDSGFARRFIPFDKTPIPSLKGDSSLILYLPKPE